MFGLFTDSMIQTRSYEFPRLNHVKRGVSEELRKLTEYIIARQLPLNNKHIVIRLIKNLGVSMKCDMYDYVYRVESNVRTITSGLDLTNSTSYGKIHKPGQFLNPHVGEIIISHTESFDVDYAVKNWQRLAPLKFLSHPCSDISYGIPNGTYTLDSEEGVAVISINIPMLALQYRCWLTEQQKLNKDVIPTLASFVYAYPLMNMAKSHADVAMFNRLYNEVHLYKNTGYVRRNPIALIDYHSQIDNVIREYAKILDRTPLSFQTIIDNVPTLFYGNFHNAIRLPKIAATSQVRWAMLVARLKIFHLLLTVDTKHRHFSNRDYINDIRITIEEMENDNLIARGFSQSELDLLVKIKQLL